jgi:hypothetical protein
MLAALGIVLGLAGHGRRGPGCLPYDRDMYGLVIRVRANVAHGKTWDGITWTGVDTFTVQPVQTDSLCDRALQAVNSFVDKTAPSVERIRLVATGRYFVAEYAPVGPYHSEFLPQFVLDSTLTKVLYPCANATVVCSKHPLKE